jgi:hypothetical protein
MRPSRMHSWGIRERRRRAVCASARPRTPCFLDLDGPFDRRNAADTGSGHAFKHRDAVSTGLVRAFDPAQTLLGFGGSVAIDE